MARVATRSKPTERSDRRHIRLAKEYFKKGLAEIKKVLPRLSDGAHIDSEIPEYFPETIDSILKDIDFIKDAIYEYWQQKWEDENL